MVRTELPAEGVALLTLDREQKRNALSRELLRTFTDQLDEWREDDAVRAIVVTGAGSTFSAGFDVTELTNPDLLPEVTEISGRYHRALWSYPKVVIAAINGAAVGGGLDMATLCDIRICSPGAVFGHPEIRLGAPPLFTPLRWLVGHGLARELCLTGRRVDAEEAARIGLVNRVVPDERLIDEAVEMAADVASLPAQAVATTKAYLVGNAGLGFEDAFRVEHDDVFGGAIELLARGSKGER